MVGEGGYTFLGGATGLGPADTNLLTTGDESMPRDLMATASITVTSGQMRLAYFTARKTEASTQVRWLTGITAAAATPTLCRIGIYEIAANGDGTLVAATANDTTLFAAVSTVYTRSWSTPFAKRAGQRYAIGPLVVTATTAPSFCGQSIVSAVEAGLAPRLAGALTGLSDVPASFLSAASAASGFRVYGVVLP